MSVVLCVFGQGTGGFRWSIVAGFKVNLRKTCNQSFAQPDIATLAHLRKTRPVFVSEIALLVAPDCAIPKDYLSDTPLLRAMGFLGVST